MDEGLIRWFAREILSHEIALTRFLRHSWIGRRELDDLRQDVYIKVLEAAETQRPLAPKAFLFATAKNLLVDRARRNRVIPIDLLQDVDSLNVLVDDISPERAVGGLQQLLRLTRALEQLPDRCREVVWMRKIEDIPQKEIAQRLQIAEATVETHLAKGIRLLTRLYYCGEGEAEARASNRAMDSESRHGN
jgi:RNA polymerase sigma factor (sigma-70 family)